MRLPAVHGFPTTQKNKQEETMLRRDFIAVMLATGFSTSPGWALAGGKPIRIIVPFAPGGSADMIPRMVAPAVAEALDQAVIIENKAGGGGSIGAGLVGRAQADGLTLGVATVSTHCIYPAVAQTAPYDPLKDFACVSNLARVPNVISVHPSVAASTMQEFVALMRESKSRLSFGSPGVGSLGHMMGELLMQQTGGKMLHVPYRGAGLALQDVLAGQVQVLCDNLPASLPHIKSGKLRALAVAWPSRVAQLASVPTFAEVGMPELNAPAWFGLVAPARVPAATVDRLQKAVAKAVARPETRSNIESVGADPLGGTAESFAEEMRAEYLKWKRVAAAAKISLA